MDVNLYAKFEAGLKKLGDAGPVLMAAKDAGATARLIKFEAMLVLIFYRSATSKPGKAVNREEDKFAASGLTPSTSVFGPLWKLAEAAKLSDAADEPKQKKAKKEKAKKP